MDLTHKELVTGLLKSDRVILGRAITLIESSRPDHREKAHKLIKDILPYTKKSIRIGITGVPGAGKSTFIESFGKWLVDKGHKVAVLAIDPSSTKNKGSILGDKTRMNELSMLQEVFIRPSPSRGTLGGVASHTKETILLCETAGYNYILVETVGVGQSETEVNQLVDFFLLLMLSGAGDELQGIKRGIMELADLLVVTKADGENEQKAKQAAAQYKNAMHLLPAHPGEWIPTALTCSSTEHKGIDKIYETINDYLNKTQINGYFNFKRIEQDKWWLHETIKRELSLRFYNHPSIHQELNLAEKNIESGDAHPIAEAMRLINLVLENRLI
ncbi:MAG: methylmalonyl Co-A mutase-associated GTPase MeaB [Flavobacteriales bacterium]